VNDEASAARCLLDRGWCVRPGARYRLRSPPAIRITIASLPAEQSRRLADDLREVLGSGPVGRGP
jgi:histidinol-phosphate/aromatic aminotransferase/cobyric acid decarboxylase-like protein